MHNTYLLPDRHEPAMMWKADLPEGGGFYYWQGGSLTGDQVRVVQVCKYKNREGFRAQTLTSDGLDLFCGDLKDYPRGRWAGPLPQPY